jgi:uroporphyrinogen-III synthase
VRPLQGRRVVVTRAPGQAGHLVRLLRDAGAEPLEFPAIAIAPPRDPSPLRAALEGLDGYAWLVLTSANGVLHGLGSRRPFPGRVAAVGPATAAALRELGWPVDWMPDDGRGAAVAEGLPIGPGEPVLILRSDLADGSLARRLLERGARVDDVVAYRTVPRQEPSPELRGLFRENAVDAVVLMSPSAVDGLLNGCGVDPGLYAGAALVSAGPTTSARIRARRLTLGAEAAAAAPEALIEALASALGARMR